MHRDRTDGVVDLELVFDPVVHLEGDEGTAAADQHGLDGMVKIVARRGADNAGETAGVGPERVTVGNQVSHHQAAGKRHQEVEGNRGQRGRLQVDVGGAEEGLAFDFEHARAVNVDNRNVTGDVETPETGIDQE